MMWETTRTLGVGSWFLRERGVFPRQVYSGKASSTALAIAMSYAGDMQFEIIQQFDDFAVRLPRSCLTQRLRTASALLRATTALRSSTRPKSPTGHGCLRSNIVTAPPCLN